MAERSASEAGRNPAIGGAPLPALQVLALGQAMWEITRHDGVRADPPGDGRNLSGTA